MAITSAIDFDKAFIVPTGGERAVRQRDFGDAPVAQKNIHRPIDLRRGVNQVTALDKQRSSS